MEIKPIKSSRRNYPTLNETLDNPELLEKNAPARWLKNGAVAGALGAYLLIGSPSEAAPLKERPKTAQIITNPQVKDSTIQTQNNSAERKVAPIFVHGTGRGSSGLSAMGGPSFISEGEAHEIILAEFKKYNIEFVTKRTPFVKLKKNFINCEFKDKEMNWDDMDSTIRPITSKYTFDGYNKELNLVFEYVSMDDAPLFKDESNVITMSSYESYDFLNNAEILRNAIVKQNKYNAVVFYDPCTEIDNPLSMVVFDFDPLSSDQNYSANEEKRKAAYKEYVNKVNENLKAQVADFIYWAKKEGLIK